VIEPDPAWRPPHLLAAAGSPASLAEWLEAEIMRLQAAHRLWVAQHGRTTSGPSGLAIGNALQASEDERLRLIGDNFMVPAARVGAG
jgi:hypothetical protein